MNTNPSEFKGFKHPVEMVSYEDARTFCQKLNQLYAGRLPRGYQFDLPTEAQWEYACRAGTSTVYSYGNASDGTKMNFNGNFPHGTHRKSFFRKAPLPVGATGYKNAFGLYDMHGNVAEWCRDGYSGSYPPGTVDPFKGATGSYRVYRGGSWFSNGKFCRSAERNGLNAGDTSDDLGFRLALVPEQ
jgi:formylglycine-generating enzyme required for sulfatase activity